MTRTMADEPRSLSQLLSALHPDEGDSQEAEEEFQDGVHAKLLVLSGAYVTIPAALCPIDLSA